MTLFINCFWYMTLPYTHIDCKYLYYNIKYQCTQYL